MTKEELMEQATIAMVAWFDNENAPLKKDIYGSRSSTKAFYERMDLCKYAEWCARKALGQPVPEEFEGVPRLVLTL